MSMCEPTEGSRPKDIIKKHFPYVRRGQNGEYIIPENKIGEFVRQYMELGDNRDHLQRLRSYLSEENRNKPGEHDD